MKTSINVSRQTEFYAQANIGLQLLCIRMPYSASEMFVTYGIPSFYELLLKCIFDFFERISRNTNSIIEACLSPKVYFFSPMRQW